MSKKFKVDVKVWKQLRAHLKKIGKDHSYVKVGVLTDEMHHSGFSLVEIAAVHEFGSRDGRIPQRSFIRAGIKDSQPQLVRFLQNLARAVLKDPAASHSAVDEALNKLGAFAANSVKRYVTKNNIPPPLSPRTIVRKGSSKPLIDTGQLVNSITWQVIP